MAYTTQSKAHSNHHITKPDGSSFSRYSRYEVGHITGKYRDMPAVLADSTGFDSLGFDSSVGSVDDNWHVVNVFDSANRYVDSMAVGGAMDSAHALQVAKSQLDSLGGVRCALVTNTAIQFDGIDNDQAWSIDAINKLMDNPSQNKNYLPAITAPELAVEAERVTFDSVKWDQNDNLISHGGKYSNLYIDLTRADTRKELVTDFDLADALFDMGAEEAGFDALMDTKQRLGLLKERLLRELVKLNTDDLKFTDATQTKEFKRQGVINIAFVFDLSDGQKLSIWFHKPLESSAKLLPSDYMVSWKWMLNKRDVTAALSPKHGDNVQLPALARRIMRLAAKNSKRFKAAQARAAKVEQELLDAEQTVADRKSTISMLDIDIMDLNKKIDMALQARKDEAEKPPEPEKPKGGAFSEGDAVIWMGEYGEISRGTFKSYSPDGTTGIFIDEGGQMRAPISQLIFNPDVQLTDEQIAAKSEADKYNEMEAIISSLSKSSKRFKEWDMTIESVQALPKEQFFRLADALAAAKMPAYEQLLIAYRVGKQDLIGMAQSIMDNEKSAGETTPEIAKRRDRLAQILNTELTLVGSKKETGNTIETATDNKVTKGSVNESTTVKGTKISSNFALVEAKKLIVSHDAAGVANPDFPQALQPRDRSDKKSVEAIKANAKKLQPEKLGQTDRVGNGAPIVGDDLVVESGNGRAMAVKLAYDNGDAENYRAWLIENADEFGFSAEQVEAYKQPVLVRVRTTAIDRMDFAIEANQDGYPQYFDNEESGDEAETTVSVYVNSRGRVLATVTKQAGKYHVKGENFSGGNYPDDASVLKQLEVVKANNASMKLKEGKEFFSADDASKNYPPVERDQDGNYIAYMDSKKKDYWSAAMQADGGFIVYPDNAQTRAYRNSKPKFFDGVADLLATYPAFKGIEKLIAEDLQAEADYDEYDEIDSSEYPQMFLDRNKDKLNILGIGDDDIHVGLEDDYDNQSDYNDLYHIDSGLFARQTLNFADAVCKTVDAAISLGADAVVGDFTATAYQDSMFDGLDSKSNPTYGITVQIEKGGVYLRAEIDAYGECKILKGASGTDVITTIKHVFTDNTNEYQSALADALDIQVDDDMSTTDTHDAPKLSVGDNVVWRNNRGELRGTYRGETDGKAVLMVNGTQMSAPADEVFADDQPAEPAAEPEQSEYAKKQAEQERLNQEAKKRLNLRAGSNDKAGSNVGDIVSLDGKRSTGVWITQVGESKVHYGATYNNTQYTSDMSYDEFEAAIERAKQTAEPVAEPATSAAAKRINEIEQQMSAADFDPMTADTDELIDLVDQVEGDAELSAKLDAISTTLQQKIVAVSMKALADMAGA